MLTLWNNAYTVNTVSNNVNEISTKYATVYKHNTTYDNTGIEKIDDTSRQIASQYNRAENINIYGDAMIETSSGSWGQTSWQENCSYFLYLDFPTVLRGGWWNDPKLSGIFAFVRNNGGPDCSVGSRAVVIAL